MELSETHIYINVPADVLLNGRDYHLQRTAEEALYTTGARGARPRQIGLLRDLLTDGSWSHLLLDGPVDATTIATALLDLNVEADQIAPTTKWDGTPYADVNAIEGEMNRQRSARLKLG